MHKSIKTYKHKILGQGWTLLLSFEKKMITTFVEKCSMNQVRSPLSWLKVHQSHVKLLQPNYHQGTEEVLHKEKGWREKLRLKIRMGCKTWAKKGKIFWQSFLILLIVVLNDIPRSLLIWELDGYLVWGWATRGKMVRKPSIALKLRRIHCNYIFFSTFGGKRGLSSMKHAFVCGLTSMQ